MNSTRNTKIKDYAKTNRSTHFYFFQKKNNAYLPPIQVRPLSTKRTTSTSSPKRENKQQMFNAFLMSEMQSIIKYTSGLLQRIQIDNDIEGTIVLNEKLQKRYNMIKNSIMSSSFDKRIRMIKDNARNLTDMYNDYACNTKEALIVNLSTQNEYLKMYLNIIRDLFTLFNMSFLREKYVAQYTEINSNFANMKIIFDKINNDFDATERRGNDVLNEENFDNPTKEVPFEESNQRNEQNISQPQPNEFLLEIQPMKTFYEFLTYESDNEENKMIYAKVKELFDNDNETGQKLLFKFITDKLHIKNNLVNRLRSVLNSRECYDTLENITSIRKILEDFFDEMKKENMKLKEEIEQLKFQLSKIEKENEQTKKRVEAFDNKNFKTLFEQIKKENEDFIKKIPEIANKCINAIIDKYENKTEKYDELKGQIRNLKNEIQFLKDKNDFTSRTSYKIGSDDYYEALQSQMDDMKDSFLEKFNDLSRHYTNKKLQFQRQIRTLENEKQYCLELQKVLIKRLKDINKYFSI